MTRSGHLDPVPAPTRTRAGRWGLIVPASVDDVFDRAGSVRAMALLRIALGPIVVLHLRPFLTDTASGVTFRDHYFEPWLPLLAEVPGTVQIAVVWVGAVAALAMMAGWQTRATSTITFLCVAGNMFLSQTYFRHNRAFLIILLAAVALSASGRVLSVDARRARRRARAGNADPVADADDDYDTVWPMWTLRALVTSVYLASGISKLVDPDWVGGLVLWDRSVRFQQFVSDRVPDPVAEVVVDVVSIRWVHTITSPLAVAVELFIGLGLWFARTRLLAVWVAITFHLSIEVSASVEVFSLAAIAGLVIWATPSTRDRVVVTNDDRWLQRLDWLDRFDTRVSSGEALSVTDRDGTELTGTDARAFVLSRLPLTFFLAAPWWAWRVIRRRGVSTT